MTYVSVHRTATRMQYDQEKRLKEEMEGFEAESAERMTSSISDQLEDTQRELEAMQEQFQLLQRKQRECVCKICDERLTVCADFVVSTHRFRYVPSTC